MPWYRQGTVAITAGQTTVTGAGTNFPASARVGDAFQGPDGRWYEIANVASSTVLSILPAYLGATVTAGAYGIAPMQGYVKDSADALRGLVNLYGAKIAALGTTGNYDVLPLAKGGTGIAADSPAALLSGIGGMPQAGGIALHPVFASVRATSGALLNAQGAYIGWNEVNGSGMLGAVSFTCNQGAGTGGFSWRTVNTNNTVGGPFMTYSYGGVLNVPTGLQLAGRNIVESGSNANGSYVRFADGTQECWLRNLGFGPAGAGVTASTYWTPPVAFLNNSATVMATLQYAETTDNFTCSRLSANLGSGGMVAVTANFSASQVYRIGLHVIGRWY